MKNQLKKITFLLLFLSFLSYSCGGSGDGNGGGGNGSGLSRTTLNLIADFLTRHAKEGLFDEPPTSDAKRDIFEESDMEIIDAVEMDVGQTILFISINPDALQTEPIEIAPSDLTVGTAEVNRFISFEPENESNLMGLRQTETELQMGINNLLITLEVLGLNTKNLRTAASDTIFHEEGDSVGGYEVKFGGSNDGISFPLDLDDSWGIFPAGGPLLGWLIIVTDGFSHTIFSMQHSNDLRIRETKELNEDIAEIKQSGQDIYAKQETDAAEIKDLLYDILRQSGNNPH